MKASDADVKRFRRDGFVVVRQVFDHQEVAQYRSAVEAAIAARHGRHFGRTAALEQSVNLWEHDEAVRALTLHPRLAAIATRLAGVPLRLWHDQALIKHPGGTPTVYHQGQPNWGHECPPDSHALTAWIALSDASLDHGCMGFVPGSHKGGSLGKQRDMQGARGLFALAPDIEWAENVRIPLAAGDVSFHHAYTVHMAGANHTDEPRIGHIVDYMDRDTRVNGDDHVVTNDLGLAPGTVLEGPRFPDLDAGGVLTPALAAGEA